MKKIIMLALTLALNCGMTMSAFAANANGSVNVQSIQEALDARNANIQKPALRAAVGFDTYIVVINYSDETIYVTFPSQQIPLTRLTASRYQRSNYTGQTYIELSNANGAYFWSGNVDYQDLVSVYVSNGQYVVYDTH